MSPHSEQAERDALKELNASIHDEATLYEAEDAWTFCCECGDLACFDGVELNLPTYEAIRADGGYILAPGHHVSRVDGTRRVARRLRDEAAALRAQAEHQRRRLLRLLGH